LDGFELKFHTGTSINGNVVIKNGNISLPKGITVQGNYTQLNSTLFAYGLSSDGHASLLINGSANIDGSLKYTVAKKRLVSGDAIVINARQGISGRFVKAEFLGNPKYTSTPTYSNDSVQVQIGPEIYVRTWWVWVSAVVGLGIVIILALACVVMVVKRLKRKKQDKGEISVKYEPIPSKRNSFIVSASLDVCIK